MKHFQCAIDAERVFHVKHLSENDLDYEKCDE